MANNNQTLIKYSLEKMEWKFQGIKIPDFNYFAIDQAICGDFHLIIPDS